MGKRPSAESEDDFALLAAGHSVANPSGLESAKHAKPWLLLVVGVLTIFLLITLGGLLRGALGPSGSMVLPTPSGVPTLYVTDPPPGPAADPGDQAPVDPAPASTAIPSGAVAPNPQPKFGTLALELLSRIPVKPAMSPTGYTRSNFGLSWLDLGVGCDSRNASLKRDLDGVVFAQGSAQCIVQAGELKDPYSGGRLVFDRAAASMIQIDEVVSLANAWQTGAQLLSAAQRIAFANDSLNLLAVDAVMSIQKHSADAADWLPPNAEFRCSYVARQISVKATYGLWLTQDEYDAMAMVLEACPKTAAPTDQPPAETDIAAGSVPDSAPANNSSPPSSAAIPAPQGSSGKLPAQKDNVPKPPVVIPQVPTRPSIPGYPPVLPGKEPQPPSYFPVPPVNPPFGAWRDGPSDWSQLPVDPAEFPLLPPVLIPTRPVPPMEGPTAPSSNFGPPTPPTTARVPS